MKILLESSVLQRKKMTGVDYYTKNLFEAIISINRKHDIDVSFFKKDGKLNLKAKNGGAHKKPIKLLSRRLYNFLYRLGIAPKLERLIKEKPDAILFPDFVAWPARKTTKLIVTVHDTAYMDVPEFVPNRLGRYLAKFVKKSVGKAALVVTISEHSKKSLSGHYGIAKDKILVVNPAVDHDFFKPASDKNIMATMKKYGIKNNYFLFVGTIEPRKNIIGIIKAYNSLDNKIRENYSLVMAGNKGWLDDDINAALSLSKQNEILNLGYVDEKDLPSLYSGATAFLYPSFYEGWGMPILEAMACGTPVIAAHNSSLPEVGGSAAIYLKRNTSVELAYQMKKLIGNKKEQEKLSRAGIERSKIFSWNKSARLLMDHMERL